MKATGVGGLCFTGGGLADTRGELLHEWVYLLNQLQKVLQVLKPIC